MAIYTNLADPVDQITLADVRTYLSIQADDQSVDTQLMSFIEMARASLEAVTGTWLAQRPISLTVPADCSAIPVRGEILTLMSVVTTDCKGMVEDVTSKAGINTSPNGSRVYIRSKPRAFVTIEFVPKVNTDEVVRLAMLTAIRKMYTDRALNPIDEEVRAILAPILSENI